MITANVYKVCDVSTKQVEAVHDGIDLLSRYTGRIVTKDLRINIPTLSKRGEINPGKVGFGCLDKLRDLHIFACPVVDDGNKRVLGRSAFLSGMAFIDTRYGSADMPITTAHETAHALGFVDPDAITRTDRAHCSDKACIMHPVLFGSGSTNSNSVFDSELSRFSVETLGVDLFSDASSKQQEDFCMPCKADIRDLTEEHLGLLRLIRLNVGQVEFKPTVSI